MSDLSDKVREWLALPEYPWPSAREEHPRTAELTALMPEMITLIENLMCLAEPAMRESNRDDGEYNIEDELFEGRELIRKIRAAVTK